jgi:hypothetical protein
MAERKTVPASVANEIRRALKAGGSRERSSSVQQFFKEEVRSHGWRTADLRRAALRWRREILQQSDRKFLLQVADHLSPTSSAMKNSDCSSLGCLESATGLTTMLWCTI